jgi:hypothetical protein
MDAALLEEFKVNKSGKATVKSEKVWERRDKYPKHYLEKIFRLCKKNNIEISFLYLPAYGTIYKEPINYNYYKNIGKVYIPPSDILDDKNNWRDYDHLNYAGGEKVSNWLVGELMW